MKSRLFSGTASNGFFYDACNFKIVGKDSLIVRDTFNNPTNTLCLIKTMEVYGAFNSCGLKLTIRKEDLRHNYLMMGILCLIPAK